MTAQDLKNSILQLAIQGKLVEQRVEEGTAKELVEQIKAEKEQLIKEKKIKKEKPLPEITEEEIPFEIPENWEWVRFGSVVEFSMGKTPPRGELEYWGDDYPWVSIADMEADGFINVTKERISKKGYIEKFNGKISSKGTLLMSFKLTVGRVSILNIDALHNEAIISILPYYNYENIIRNYYFKVLPYLSTFGQSKKAIMGYTLNSSSINNLLIPLPPLEEQKRIVTKIEELLPYLEQYDNAYSKLEVFNKKFPEDMQKSILQYAIQGKLVEQRPEEGTAEELYQQIQEEKERLIKEGKIKKEKPLSEITEDEIPFEIPENWKWVRFSEIIDVRDGTHGTPLYLSTGYPLITGKDFYNGYFELSKTQYISKNDYEEIRKRSNVEVGDILFSMIGGNIGSMILINDENYFEMAIKNVALFKQYSNNMALSKYLLYYLKSQVPSIKATANGGAQSFVPLKVLRNYLLPLPPMSEQKRIVRSLEEYLPYCTQLIK